MPTQSPRRAVVKLRDQRAFTRSKNQCTLAAERAGKTPLEGQIVYPGLEMVWRPPTTKGSARSIVVDGEHLFPILRVVTFIGQDAVVRFLNYAYDSEYPGIGFMPLRTLLENYTPALYEVFAEPGSARWCKSRAWWMATHA
jgi:hypothetical protein